jgi:beta-1,4-mannosyl-glycoprotein beta-1,4-N-acetylglucosaminyltransferase
MTVYDCCSFLNENDLYEIRINQHWDFVDKFIVVEARETHTGLPKPLNFDHKRFEPYKDKLVYVVIDNFKEEIAKYPYLLDNIATGSHGPNSVNEDWERCYFQDNYFAKVLEDLGAFEDDLVYVACLDEIIKKEAFEQCLSTFKEKDTRFRNNLRPVFFFQMYLYAYKLNLLCKGWGEHHAAYLTEVGNFSNVLPASIRHLQLNTHPLVPDAGWHFTFLDNTDGEMVLAKQRSWAHSKDKYEGKKTKFEHTTKEEAVARFFEDYQVQKVNITIDTHPKYVVDNLEKFQDCIYHKEL